MIQVNKTQFRYHYADGNPMWTVIEKRGRGTWIAEVNADELDYAGVCKAFTTQEIEGSIAMTQMWSKMTDASEEFYNKLTPGSIVHYNNGFDSYVRCKITDDHQLLPIALVGEWSELDLPRRMRNGKIMYGYHAESIKTGKVFKPHASNIWEYNLGGKKKDPTNLPPINLELPEMTVQEIEQSKKYIVLEQLQTIVNDSAPADVIFSKVKALLIDTNN